MKHRVWIRGVSVLVAAACAGVSTVQAEDSFIEITPCRIVDTRPTSSVQGAGGPLLGGSARTFQVTGAIAASPCNIPQDAKAVALVITAFQPTVDGFVSLYPANLGFPRTAIVAVSAGANTVNNGAIVPIAFVGGSALQPSLHAIYGTLGGGQTHLILDVMGYFVDKAPTSLFGRFGGTGADGDVVIGNNAPGGAVANYRNLTIQSGATLSPQGPFTFYAVQGTCTIAGTLSATGAGARARPIEQGESGRLARQRIEPEPLCVAGSDGAGGGASPTIGGGSGQRGGYSNGNSPTLLGALTGGPTTSGSGGIGGFEAGGDGANGYWDVVVVP